MPKTILELLSSPPRTLREKKRYLRTLLTFSGLTSPQIAKATNKSVPLVRQVRSFHSRSADVERWLIKRLNLPSDFFNHYKG